MHGHASIGGGIGNIDVWITFVIAHQDVVTRMEFFDQIAFENQRFTFCVRDYDFDMINMTHHHRCFRRQARAAEIAADAIL